MDAAAELPLLNTYGVVIDRFFDQDPCESYVVGDVELCVRRGHSHIIHLRRGVHFNIDWKECCSKNTVYCSSFTKNIMRTLDQSYLVERR